MHNTSSKLIVSTEWIHRYTEPSLLRNLPVKALRLIALSFFSLVTAATAQTIPPAVKAATGTVDPEKIRAHVKFLSDDLLEGRGPGTRGGEIAAQYIATQFALYGLKPAGDNGTYLQ